MNRALACLAAIGVLGVSPAAAQRILTESEMSMCVAYTDFSDRIYKEWKTVDTRLNNYSLNRRSESSVDRYNDLVAVANNLHAISKSWDAYLKDKCIDVRSNLAAYQSACRTRHFDLSFQSNSFCARWRTSSLDQQEQIESVAMELAPSGEAPHAIQQWNPLEIADQ